MTNTQKCREAAKDIDRAAANFNSPLTNEKIAKIIKRYFPEPAKVDGDDSKRLDWLCSHSKTGNYESPYWKIYQTNPGDDLRAAIDAAINKPQ